MGIEAPGRHQQHKREPAALDLGLGPLINGLPIATFELKNSQTQQSVEDPLEPYRGDRKPRERLFEHGRCVLHFAADDAEVRRCIPLTGKAWWFLPFTIGHNHGAGNPPNPRGLQPDWLGKEVLTPARLIDILENQAPIVEVKRPGTRKKKRTQVFPRHHPLGAVRQAVASKPVRRSARVVFFPRGRRDAQESPAGGDP